MNKNMTLEKQIKKTDMENIVTAMEINVKEFLDRMIILSEKMTEWAKIYGEVEEESDWGQRLKKLWEMVQ